MPFNPGRASVGLRAGCAHCGAPFGLLCAQEFREQVPEATFGQGAELTAVAQLMMTTKEKTYAARFNELLWPSLDRMAGPNMLTAARALPFLDAAYAQKLRPYVVKYKGEMDALQKQNPYGVPITTGGWGGNGAVVSWATANYYLHETYPDLVGPEYVFRLVKGGQRVRVRGCGCEARCASSGFRNRITDLAGSGKSRQRERAQVCRSPSPPAKMIPHNAPRVGLIRTSCLWPPWCFG